MVSYAQLEAEPYWDREIVTPELKQFEAWLRDHFGLPADAIGDKGNNAHLSGSHRSQEWIERSRFCTNRTYTVEAGLTADQKRHIAGVDITPNTRADMLAMSQRIDRATRAGQLEEVVYWYGNTNGDQRVDGYDNIRNALATSDASHLWHLHLGLDRRILRDLAALRRVFAVLAGNPPDSPEGDDDMANTWTQPVTQNAGRPYLTSQQRDTVLAIAAGGAADANAGVQQLIAEAAAEKVRDAAEATAIAGLVAAVNALSSGGGNVDSAPIIAAVREVGAKADALAAQVTALQQENAALKVELAATREAVEANLSPAEQAGLDGTP